MDIIKQFASFRTFLTIFVLVCGPSSYDLDKVRSYPTCNRGLDLSSNCTQVFESPL